jgi:hypothetical protein
MRSAIRICLTLTALTASSLLLACGGSAQPSAPSGEATTVPETVSEREEPQEADLFSVFDEVEPSLPNVPPDTDTLVGGAFYRAAAERVKASLAAAGITEGIEVYILPVAGTDSSLLIFDAEITADQQAPPEDAIPALRALLDAEAVRAANVTRFVLTFSGEDEEGPLVVTMTMPLEILGKMIDETITDEESASQVLFGVERP